MEVPPVGSPPDLLLPLQSHPLPSWYTQLEGMPRELLLWGYFLLPAQPVAIARTIVIDKYFSQSIAVTSWVRILSPQARLSNDHYYNCDPGE